MVYIQTKIYMKIPQECPKCGNKLHHVNALDTKAQIYIVFCLNRPHKCKWCKEYTKKELMNCH